MEQLSMRKSVEKYSDIDFHDVFGGPPRRSSMQDTHVSYLDYDEPSKWRSSWSCSGAYEMPVFGEVHAKRRSDCFFDDIFQGEKQGLDSPGSRVLSPVSRLSSNTEVFAHSSVPAHFSLPANLPKEVDLPAFGDDAHSTYKTANSASNGTKHSREELMHDVRSYCPSPLSRDISRKSKASSTSISSDGWDKSKEDLDKENTKSSHFHFSIYQWADKGVPSLISVRAGRNSKLKEKTKFERSSSFRSWIASKRLTENLHNPSASAITDNLDVDKDSAKMDYVEKENELLSDGSSEHIMEIQQNNQEPEPLMSETKYMDSIWGSVNDAPHNHISQNAGPVEGSQSLAEEVAAKKFDEEISDEARKSEARSLPVLFYSEEPDTGNNKISPISDAKEDKGKATNKSSVFNIKQKKQDEEGSTQINEQVNKSSSQISSIKKGHKEGMKKVKGKVKNIVKMFNQEASSSSKIDIDTGSKSNRSTSGFLMEKNEGSVETTKANDKMQMPDVNEKKMSTDASVKADEYIQESGNQHSAKKTSDYVPNNTSAGQKNSSASNPNASKASEKASEQYYSGNFQVNDALQAEDEPLKRDNNQEDTQVGNAKIRKWSNGKEGNIRSLLSTLQYVLWPESGWKPVPLVDIIEGNAVKKAYQKALLCLHPDKLQQKGASSHQKYIAEKVFDMLQEAWDHFNSLNPL